MSTTFVKPKTPEELGFDVNTKGIYAMCETTWADAMIGQYARTGVYTLQFGVGDTTSANMIQRFGTLSSSKDLEEQKFFVDAIPNPGYRDHDLHPIIRQTFAYQVSDRKDKREVFATEVDKTLAEMFIKTGDFEPIRQWLSTRIRKCAGQLNKDHKKLAVKLRDIQLTVLNKIIKTIYKNGIGSNIIAELAPRLGKTILFLMTAKELRETFGHQAMFVLAYGVGLSVKTSYKDEISKFINFEDFVFIDNTNNNAKEQYKTAITEGKFPVVFVSLNAKTGDDEKEERLDWIGTQTENVIALLEETDFGMHTESQIEKTQNMFANMTVTQINSSGTNIGRIAKASGDKPADEIIRVPYCMVEQDSSVPNIVKRKFYNIIFNAKMNKLLEGFDSDVLPNITKILADARTQEKFLTALFQDIFDYQPIYGLSLNRQSTEIIDHTMLFTNITKTQMIALKEVIERACPEHQVLILNSDETSNKEAQGRTFEELVALKNGKYGKRNKLIVITNMMGTRSYSVPQIQACLFMMEGGDVYPYMQRYSRCLTPGFDKLYGHIFDFAFDTNKTRNTEMSIAIEAAAVMEQKSISFPDAVREVMFSVNIRDMVEGKWLDANDIIFCFENNDKLVEVANALSRVEVNDFADADFPFLAELAKRAMSKTEKSNFEKNIKTGKTYEDKKRKGINTTLNEDNTYKKSLLEAKKVIERAIRMLNSSASTVTEFANYKGKTYQQCLEIIADDNKLTTEFIEMFGVDVNFVRNIKDKLPLATLDLIVERTIQGEDKSNIANSSLGIVADDPNLWREIFQTSEMQFKLNSNDCKKILVIAGGLGTEINVLVELYGLDILDKIVYNDKYTSFCNRIKQNYSNITVMQGDFLNMEFNMEFDVIVGNPPYQNGNQGLWQDFSKKSVSLLKDGGTMTFVTPNSWANGSHLNTEKNIFNSILQKYNCVEINTNANNYFKGIGKNISYWTIKKEPYNGLTKIIDKNKVAKNIDISKYPFFLNIFSFEALEIFEKIIKYNSFYSEFVENSVLLDRCFAFPKAKHVSYDSKGYIYDDINENFPTSKVRLNLDCNDKTLEQVKSIHSQFESSTFKFLWKIFGANDAGSFGWILRNMPKLPDNKIYSDADVYKELGLTNFAKYIETNIK